MSVVHTSILARVNCSYLAETFINHAVAGKLDRDTPTSTMFSRLKRQNRLDLLTPLRF